MKVVITILTILSINFSFSQGYLDSISNNSCKCINELSTKLNSNDYTIQMGLCMMKAAQPYSEKLKKDHKIDIEDFEGNDGEKLGKLIAFKLLSDCPDFVNTISKVMDSDYVGDKKSDFNTEDIIEPPLDSSVDVESSSIEGEIVNIETENFIVFSIKDDLGKLTKYYWLTFIESDEELSANYLTFKGKIVEIEYIKQDFFDPKINEYRTFNVILSIYEVEQ